MKIAGRLYEIMHGRLYAGKTGQLVQSCQSSINGNIVKDNIFLGLADDNILRQNGAEFLFGRILYF